MRMRIVILIILGSRTRKKVQIQKGLEAQNGAMEVLERSKWRRRGSKLSRRGSVNLDEEQEPDPGPHYSEKSHLDPHFSGKRDPDPH